MIDLEFSFENTFRVILKPDILTRSDLPQSIRVAAA
jgi:hypothetical protein